MSKIDGFFASLGAETPEKVAVAKSLLKVVRASSEERPEALEKLVGQIHDLYASDQTAAISIALHATHSVLPDVVEMGFNTLSDLALRKDNLAPMFAGLVDAAVFRTGLLEPGSPLIGKLGNALDTIAQRDLTGADGSTAADIAKEASRLTHIHEFADLGREIVARTGILPFTGSGFKSINPHQPASP